MNTRAIMEKLRIAASQQTKERNYWLKKLSGHMVKNHFPYDFNGNRDLETGEPNRSRQKTDKFHFAPELVAILTKLSRQSPVRMFIILAAGVVALLYKYTDNTSINLGMPIYKQDVEGEFINRVLVLRTQFNDRGTFRELLNGVRLTIAEAVEHQDYPIEVLPEDLNISTGENESLLFDTSILMEGLHDKQYIQYIPTNICFLFRFSHQGLEGIVEYNPFLYKKTTVERLFKHLERLLAKGLANMELKLSDLEFLTAEDRKHLLEELNNTNYACPGNKTIHELFAEEAIRNPGKPSVSAYLDLNHVYDALSSTKEKPNPDPREKLEKCCFKKNSYVYQFQDNRFLKALNMFDQRELDQLTLLRTHRDNYVAINPATLLILDHLAGKANLKSLTRAVMNKTLRCWVHNIIIDLETGQVELQPHKFTLNGSIEDTILLIKALYCSSLIELVDYHSKIVPLYLPIDEENLDASLSVENPTPVKILDIGEKSSRREPRQPSVLLLGDRAATASTGLLYIASYLRRNGINAYCLWNSLDKTTNQLKKNIQGLLVRFKPSIVGISMKWFPHIARVLEIAQIIKNHDPSVKVVVGGNTASYYKKEIIRNQWVDIVVTGDGEIPFLKICQAESESNISNCVYKKNGTIMENPIEYVQNETNSPEIFLSHLDEIFVTDLDPFLTSSFYINTGKGCLQECLFCAGCRQVQEKTFNRKKPFLRGAREVRRDLMAAKEYTARFMFDFDLSLYDSLDYYKKIWEGIDLSNHFCRFYFWQLPSREFIHLVVKTFKFVYLNVDLCSLSERHRLQLTALKVVKPQPTDAEVFAFFDECDRFDNVEVIINHITGLPHFSVEDIQASKEMVNRLMEKYRCFKEMDWGRLHAQPGAAIVETCEEYGMHSYAKTYEDFLYYSKLNLKEEKYPELFTFNYPYIYFNDESLNAKITRYYADADVKVRQHKIKRRRKLKMSLEITYQQLEQKSNQLAAGLIERGVIPGSLVGLWCDRSIEMVIGLLAILKAGAAYAPIDPNYPPERVVYILKDSNARFLLTGGKPAKAIEFIEDNVEIVDLMEESPSCGDLSRTAPVSTPDTPAYVIYTSGSTGKPKGVVVEHGSAACLVKHGNFICFSPGDKLLLTGAIAFDISTFEIWAPLLNGITLCLAHQDLIVDAEELEQILRDQKISILHLIPQLFNQTAEQRIEIFSRLKYLLVGGDFVHPYYINRIRSRYENLSILHMYGPTENTTFSTFFPVKCNCELSIPIGKPIDHSTVYILDKNNHLMPFAVPGELCVGGKGVARGYLNNPELTREKFVRIEVSMSRISYIYKTGDLAKWRSDGNIEFLGRKDHQIKIRGYRIELGEVEEQLLTHKYVKEAVVIDRKTRSDDERGNPNQSEKYLCAYIVIKKVEDFEPTPSLSIEFRRYLAQRLPDYMIPSYFVNLDKIPLTPNGKIDRKALPVPALKTSADSIAPGNWVEEKLVEIWSEVLGLSHTSPGIDDNFFHLGGHSLKATVMAAKIHKELNIKLNLTDIFKAQTIRGLSEIINGSTGDRYQSVKPVEKREYYHLTSAQKRLYILQQLDPGSTGYNIPLILEVAGKLSEKNLEGAFQQLVQRHESFRTSFERARGEAEPVQKIHPATKFQMERYVLKGTQEKIPGAAYEFSHPEEIIDSFLRPFDLSEAPLVRVGLIIKENNHVLMVDMHHIISDGSSHQVVTRDFWEFYQGRKLPNLKLQYKDYAEWRNKAIKDILKKQETYWLNQFKSSAAVLNLPTDFARPEVQAFAGNFEQFEINREQTRALKQIAVDAQATLFMVLLAISNVFLVKISDQDDVVIGVPISGHQHPDMEKIVGMFVNTLPIRNFPSPGKIFKVFLNEVKKNTLNAFENQDYPFEDLVDTVVKTRDISRNPLFDVSFNFVNFNKPGTETHHLKKENSRLNLKPYNHQFNISKFDLEFQIVEVEQRLQFALIYSTKLFKREKIQLFIEYYKNIISFVIDNPGKRISEIDIKEREENEIFLNQFMENLEEE